MLVLFAVFPQMHSRQCLIFTLSEAAEPEQLPPAARAADSLTQHVSESPRSSLGALYSLKPHHAVHFFPAGYDCNVLRAAGGAQSSAESPELRQRRVELQAERRAETLEADRGNALLARNHHFTFTAEERRVIKMFKTLQKIKTPCVLQRCSCSVVSLYENPAAY